MREDPAKRGLLVAGTERGVWYSADDGAHWQTLRLNLPIVPVHDLTFKDGDIVLATHGRSFYIMDDITTLEQMSDAVAASAGASVQAARPVSHGERGRIRRRGGGGAPAATSRRRTRRFTRPGRIRRAASSCSTGSRSGGEDVALDFLDAAGTVLRSYTSRGDSSAAQPATPPSDDDFGRPAPTPRVANKRGVNTFLWNMRYPDAASFPGMILWAASVTGPLVPPGDYRCA